MGGILIESSNDYLTNANIHFLGATATVNITGLPENVTMQNDNYDGVIIVALYDNAGRLLNLKEYAPQENITAEVPNSITYKSAKVMWWEDLNSLKPICEAKTVYANE